MLLPSCPRWFCCKFFLTRQIFALGKSTVGTGAESTPYARNTSVSITGVSVSSVGTNDISTHLPSLSRLILLTSVSQGDIIYCDPIEGVVAIPRGLLDETLSLISQLVAADEKVMKAVEQGVTVAEAFRAFRE